MTCSRAGNRERVDNESAPRFWIYHPHQLSVSTRWQNGHYLVNPDGAGASRMALDTRLTPRRIDALLRVALNVRRASMCRPGVRLMDKVYKTVTKSINPLKLDLAEQKMASTVYYYCSRGACRSARPSWRRRSSRAITRGSKLADALETWARSTRRASPSGAGRRGARAAARRPAALPAGRCGRRGTRGPAAWVVWRRR